VCGDASGEGSPEGRSGAEQSLINLRQPGPFLWKLQRVLLNTGIKIARRQRCCGHAGEPGC
jgi:hypothetical protein